MNIDRAVDAASKRLRIVYGGQVCDSPHEVAKRAVEAAAPLIRENWGNVVWELQRAAEIRAETAEGAVEIMKEEVRKTEAYADQAETLADLLAETLIQILHDSCDHILIHPEEETGVCPADEAISAWAEARRA